MHDVKAFLWYYISNAVINWNINGSINWSINGSINGIINGSIKGSINGSIKGSINWSIKGSINGSIKGSINGRKIQTGPLTVQFTYSWLPTKDETSETIVRNLFRPFSWIQSSLSIPTLAYFCLWSFNKSPIVCRNQKSRFKSSYFQSFMSSFQSDYLWVTLYTITSSRLTVKWRSYLRAELFLQLLKECYVVYLMQLNIVYCINMS